MKTHKIPNKRWFSVDRMVGSLFFSATFLSLVVTGLIIFFLTSETLKFFDKVSLGEFFLGTEWSPLIEPKKFGVLPLVTGTLQITFASGLLAIPLGLLVAIYISEYAKPRTRNILKPLLDLISGIPSVVYGFLAVTHITPLLQVFIPELQFFNSLSAGIVVGIMITPLVTSLSLDAIRSVPKEIKSGAAALGANKQQITFGVLIPAAGSGVLASFIIALSRAIGETMAVTLAAGATPQLTWSPLVGIQTMTAYIAQVSLGDTPANSIEFESLFAVASLLFVMTFGLNILARKIIKRIKLHHG